MGFIKNNIVFSQKQRSWLIVEDTSKDIFKLKSEGREPTKIVGVFKTDTMSNQMPIGMHLWNITECEGKRFLKLTPVSSCL